MMALGKRLQWGAWVMLAAAVGGCSSLSSLNPFGSSSSKGAALVSFQPTLTTRTEWSASVGAAGAYVFQPAVVGSAVFAAGFDGTVARFEDGKAVWKVNAERKLTAGVGANARLAVVASEKGEVIALDAATGSVKWVHKINAEVLAPPSVGMRWWWCAHRTTGSWRWMWPTASASGSTSAAIRRWLCVTSPGCPSRAGWCWPAFLAGGWWP